MLTADQILSGILLCFLAAPLLLLQSLGGKPKLNFNLLQLGKIPHRSLLRLAKKYGPLMYLKLGSVPTLVVSDADMAEEIYRLHDSVFCSRPTSAVGKRLSYGGHGVAFASYGEGWRQLPKIKEEVRVLVKTIAETSAAGQPPTSAIWPSASSTTLSAGKLSAGAVRRTAIFQAPGSVLSLPLFPSVGWLDWLTGFHGQLEKAFTFLDNLLEEEIEDHLKRDNEDDRDFMSVLLRLQKDTSLGFNLTREQIKTVLLEIFLGGSETTASVIEFGMLELALNTRSMKNVNVRGYDIPAKTMVIANIWAIMRDPGFWKDPEVFWPERFEDSDLQYKGHDFHYIPFLSGRRICPGMNLAVTSELPDGMKPEDVASSEAIGLLFHLKTPLR
ncbi:unnamed protein product [Spirodela intermedia]|uniref:Uncharacterized protein n=1 Tax=Spirodela intermedia TaxID=51605 RepID=A0A7I8IAN2_SPIIN|nr:unnamed protein product [Spirodela intermedia]CAA6654618.1 unnamed protein product [Spirodela intermedia]